MKRRHFIYATGLAIAGLYSSRWLDPRRYGGPVQLDRETDEKVIEDFLLGKITVRQGVLVAESESEEAVATYAAYFDAQKR